MTIKKRVETYIKLKGREDYIRCFFDEDVVQKVSHEDIVKYWHLVKCAYSELSGIDCLKIPLDITIKVVADELGLHDYRGQYVSNRQEMTINTVYATNLIRTLSHELVHHLQHIVHPEYFTNYVTPKHSWDSYILQTSETEALAISWYLTEGIELDVFNDINIFARLKLMFTLDKIGAKFTWKDWVGTILNKSHE